MREIEAADDGSGDPGGKPERAQSEGAKPDREKPGRENPDGERADRRGYHHGRLKDALIEAARALIKQRGPAGFSLTEAARLVGVTPAAPYRHFPDRDALMEEVARRGFALFGARMQEAWDEGRPVPATAFGRMGAAYLDFAARETGYYRAMFTRADVAAASPELAGDSFAALQRAAAAVLRAQGAGDAGARRLALETWALSHGIATLALGGFLPSAGEEAADLLASGTRALIAAAASRAESA